MPEFVEPLRLPVPGFSTTDASVSATRILEEEEDDDSELSEEESELLLEVIDFEPRLLIKLSTHLVLSNPQLVVDIAKEWA